MLSYVACRHSINIFRQTLSAARIEKIQMCAVLVSLWSFLWALVAMSLTIRFTGRCHGEYGLPGAKKRFGLETIVGREPCAERERDRDRETE